MDGVRDQVGPVAGRARTAAFRFIFASALMSAISFSIVIPILPALVRNIAGGDTAQAAEWMMLFASAWGLAQFVCSPLLGALSDRWGRRPVLVISTFGLGLDFVFMAFAPTLPLLLMGRVISGATAASFATAHAYLADITSPEDRAAAFGRIASSISIGFLIGPAFGGWLGEFDLRAPFLAAAAVTLVNGLYGLLVLPESLPPERRSARLRLRPILSTGGLSFLRSRPAWRGSRASASSTPWPIRSGAASGCSSALTGSAGRRAKWGWPSWRPAWRAWASRPGAWGGS
jgi:DHA1 family tetracycline resistance protein-like MFS transporter